MLWAFGIFVGLKHKKVWDRKPECGESNKTILLLPSYQFFCGILIFLCLKIWQWKWNNPYVLNKTPTWLKNLKAFLWEWKNKKEKSLVSGVNLGKAYVRDGVSLSTLPAITDVAMAPLCPSPDACYLATYLSHWLPTGAWWCADAGICGLWPAFNITIHKLIIIWVCKSSNIITFK